MIKKNKDLLIKALKFTLIMIPIAIVAGIFTGIYSVDTATPEMLELVIEQVGSTNMLIVITAIQTISYAVVFGFFGYIIADKIGLIKSFKVEKAVLLKNLVISVIGGLVFIALDYFVFAPFIPVVAESYDTMQISPGSYVSMLIASVTYGGVVEEIMLRLFFMSIISLILWKIFFRKYDKENIPTKVFVIANILSAMFFAAGHLPATIATFGGITAMILIRCFVMNGAAGLLFGYMYRKNGIQYAMLAHIMFHVVMKLVVLLFI